jgi:hypothetical protein
MRLKRTTDEEIARSALSAVAAATAFRLGFIRQMRKGKAVAAATALQGAFGTAIFITA